ncbi:MAG: FAD-binding protein [Phycisphaerae bacterium]
MQTHQLNIDTTAVPVTTCNTVIVGAGAAAMNCALQLVRFWQSQNVEDPAGKVVVVTGGKSLGASRMSGSDKQTYYKMGTSPRVPDTAEDFARALTGFGCCHGDNALVEGIGSLRGFYNLVEAGVPFPHEPFGAFIGYKTDHDPYERATSAGPKTSKFMSECLEAKLQRLGVQIFDKQFVVELLTDGEGQDKRIIGLVTIDRSRAGAEDMGVTVFAAENYVLAAGGPGEVYQTTVYPKGQYGIHAPAFAAGLEAANFTESQYGLASIKFRWNVSGTYMQVVPRIFSTDADGNDEREFLVDYFENMSDMASNIFLKGYQWPFDAQRITDYQSSLIDMAVHQETVVKGRRVFMDFLKNPVGDDNWDDFDIEAMSDEAKDYLLATGATQDLPIDRLGHMNPPAIDIYTENGIDLWKEPLEIAVCAQHMNGGFAVDKWWQSNIRHTFVIGEMAGTHGVKRPGGSALNAGQVGATRAAEYIANVYGPDEVRFSEAEAKLSAAVAESVANLRNFAGKAAEGAITPEEAMDRIGRRMTVYGAHLRSREGSAAALAEAVEMYKALIADGVKFESPDRLWLAVLARQQCLTHIGLLSAICGMFDRRVGSRGSHCILDPEGIEMHPKLTDPATGQPYRFKPENESLRNEILLVRLDPDSEALFATRTIEPRPVPDRQIAFEPAWSEYREGKIYEI